MIERTFKKIRNVFFFSLLLLQQCKKLTDVDMQNLQSDYIFFCKNKELLKIYFAQQAAHES